MIIFVCRRALKLFALVTVPASSGILLRIADTVNHISLINRLHPDISSQHKLRYDETIAASPSVLLHSLFSIGSPLRKWETGKEAITWATTISHDVGRWCATSMQRSGLRWWSHGGVPCCHADEVCNVICRWSHVLLWNPFRIFGVPTDYVWAEVTWQRYSVAGEGIRQWSLHA